MPFKFYKPFILCILFILQYTLLYYIYPLYYIYTLYYICTLYLILYILYLSSHLDRKLCEVAVIKKHFFKSAEGRLGAPDPFPYLETA